MRSSISNSDKTIDSRDIIERISELRSEADEAVKAAKTARERLAEITTERAAMDADASIDDTADEALEEEADTLTASLWTAEDDTELTDAIDEDDYTELLALEAFAADAESSTSEWTDGAILIHADHFQDYAEELAEDIGAIDRKASWPLNFIDWEAAAEALKDDYSEVTFDGQAYYVRDC